MSGAAKPAAPRTLRQLAAMLLLAGCSGLPLSDDAGAPAKGASADLYRSLAPAERRLAADNRQATLESVLSDEARHWRSNGSSHSGFVMPLRTFKITSGHYCREYLEAVVVGGEAVTQIATACRDGDAIWKVVQR